MAAAQEDSGPPPQKLVFAEGHQLSLLVGPDRAGDEVRMATDGGFAPLVGVMSTHFSPSGELLAALYEDRLEVFGTSEASGEGEGPRWVAELPKLQAVAFSPQGTYVQAILRPRQGDGGNLVVLSAADGAELARFPAGRHRRAVWPVIEWTADEVLAFRLANNAVQVHHGRDWAAPLVDTLRVAHLMTKRVAPGPPPYKVAVGVAEHGGAPAQVHVHAFPELATATASRSFFQAEEMDLRWSPSGEALLVKSSTAMAGNSYYGNSSVFLLSADGELASAVPLGKDGPVFDVQWGPTGRDFVVIAGDMPAQAMLFNASGAPIFDFGELFVNEIIWAPHGRFLCLAGLGNLQGQLYFWDRYKQKLMGEARAECTVAFGWSPDSRYFMAATCFTRVRVDNGLKLFKYNGQGPVFERPVEKLMDAKWRPAAPGVYPDRKQTPVKKRPDGTVEGAAPAAAAAAPAPKKAGVYRPPHATGSLSALMRRETKGGSAKKISKRTAPAVQHNLPVGAAPPPEASASAKNKARRERRRKAKEAADATAAALGGEAAAAAAGAGAGGEAAPAAAAAAAPAPAPAPAAPVDPAKQIRNLNKKLKQIEALKKRQADGEELNEDQLAKLATEAGLREQLVALS